MVNLKTRRLQNNTEHVRYALNPFSAHVPILSTVVSMAQQKENFLIFLYEYVTWLVRDQFEITVRFMRFYVGKLWYKIQNYSFLELTIKTSLMVQIWNNLKGCLSVPMSHVVWEADADCYWCSSHEHDQTYAELLMI